MLINIGYFLHLERSDEKPAGILHVFNSVNTRLILYHEVDSGQSPGTFHGDFATAPVAA